MVEQQPEDTRGASLSPLELRLDLLENGLDFIREGVENIYGRNRQAQPRDYKYALLHMFSGALLLLKERLRVEDESLIYVNDQRTKTVDFDQALKRLRNDVGIRLDPVDIQLLRRTQRKRNELEHRAAMLTLDQANAMVGELVEFVERFLHDELHDSLFAHINSTAAAEVAELKDVAARLHSRRVAEWRDRASEFFELDDDALDHVASSAAYHPRHNPDGGLRRCPECGEESLAQKDQDIGVCTNRDCAEVTMLERCGRCGATAVLSTFGCCEDCESYIQHVMDHD